MAAVAQAPAAPGGQQQPGPKLSYGQLVCCDLAPDVTEAMLLRSLVVGPCCLHPLFAGTWSPGDPSDMPTLISNSLPMLSVLWILMNFEVLKDRPMRIHVEPA